MKTVSRARSLRTELEACLPASQERLWNRVEAIDPKGVVRKTAGFDMPTWAFAAGALWGLLGREFVDRTASEAEPDQKG